jgi:hypothetical protein
MNGGHLQGASHVEFVAKEWTLFGSQHDLL